MSQTETGAIGKRILLEAVVFFVCIAAATLIEVSSRDLLFVEGALRWETIELVVRNTLRVVLYAMLGFGVIKAVFTAIYRNLFSGGYGQQSPGLGITSDLFFMAAFGLMTIPTKPIIRRTYLETNIDTFETFFVFPDPNFSLIMLSILAMPAVYFIVRRGRPWVMVWRFVLMAVAMLAVVSWHGYTAHARYIALAESSWVQQDWAAQSTFAKSALEVARGEKNQAVAYYWMGVAENRMRNHEQAKEYQIQAVTLWPEYYKAHASLANAYTLSDNSEEALYHANECVKYDPNYAWCYQARMNSYLKMQDIESAKIDAAKAVELNPYNRELEDIHNRLQQY